MDMQGAEFVRQIMKWCNEFVFAEPVGTDALLKARCEQAKALVEEVIRDIYRTKAKAI